MIKIKNLLFFLLFFQLSAHAAVEKNWIDNQVQKFIKDKPVKSVIYGLWINDQPITINAMGDSMTGVPATTAMHFRIGGVTETMLTTLLMKLSEEKILSLKDPVSQWFPHLPNAKNVNLNMLANCSSGFRDYVFVKEFNDYAVAHPFKQWASSDLIKYAEVNNPVFDPDKNQQYSHTDFVLLGEILSKATHQSINTLFQNYIFKPLKMSNTEYNDLTASISSPLLHAFSQDRNIYEDTTFWNPSSISSSGAVTSTITDLGIWGNAWMNSLLISQDSTEQLRAPTTVGKGKNTKNLYFAMGFAFANHWLIQTP